MDRPPLPGDPPDDPDPLQQLSPSPIDSPLPSQSKQSPFVPPSHTSPLGLSHNINYYLIRVQKYSSYTFSLYLIAHITNTSLIPLLTRSVTASEPYILLTRPYYQSPLAEPLIVVLPLAAHIGAGLALRLHRRFEQARRYGVEGLIDHQRHVKWARFSGTSILGYALGPLVGIHVVLNRLTPLKVEGGSSGVGLGYVAHGFARHPVMHWLGYVSLVGTASWHVVWGMSKWWGWAPESAEVLGPERGRVVQRRKWVINFLAVGLAALWMSGGLGVVGRGGEAKGWVGAGYDKLYSSVPVVGAWM